jgi:hypothetical protein
MFNQNMRINFLAILLAQFAMIKNLWFFPGVQLSHLVKLVAYICSYISTREDVYHWKVLQ